MTLADASLGSTVTVDSVGGQGSFRRRLLELGLLPGTTVTLMGVAPLGDPLELLIRGASMSIRRADAAAVKVSHQQRASQKPAVVPQTDLALGGDNWAGSTP